MLGMVYRPDGKGGVQVTVEEVVIPPPSQDADPILDLKTRVEVLEKLPTVAAELEAKP